MDITQMGEANISIYEHFSYLKERSVRFGMTIKDRVGMRRMSPLGR